MLIATLKSRCTYDDLSINEVICKNLAFISESLAISNMW